jgi:hypothetical protein
MQRKEELLAGELPQTDEEKLLAVGAANAQSKTGHRKAARKTRRKKNAEVPETSVQTGS